MCRIVVTGADGFVGSALCIRLLQCGLPIVRAVRRVLPGQNRQVYVTGDLESFTAWTELVANADTVVHLANRAHVLKDQSADPLEAVRRANVHATIALARSAAEIGAKRFVYVSSIHVNGLASQNQPFREDDPPAPADPYGASKLEAERALRLIESRSGMEVVIVRPPLVYGPGVKGNMLRLMGAIYRELPLPFGAVRNARSLISVENLSSFLATCVTHPAAGGELFFASDHEDISTPALIRALANALAKQPRLYRVPAGLLRFAATLSRSRESLERLTRSLQVDSSKARRVLGWEPRQSLAAGLDMMARWYLMQRRLGC